MLKCQIHVKADVSADTASIITLQLHWSFDFCIINGKIILAVILTLNLDKPAQDAFLIWASFCSF